MKGRSLTGVGGVARRHRAGRNTGSPTRREVAAVTFAGTGKPRGVAEGRVVPNGLAGQQNRRGGKAPWFEVRFEGLRGGRLA